MVGDATREAALYSKRAKRKGKKAAHNLLSLLAACKLLATKQFSKTSHRACPAGQQGELPLKALKSWGWLGWTGPAVAQAGLPQPLAAENLGWTGNLLNDAAEPPDLTCYWLLTVHPPCRKQCCRVTGGVTAPRCCWAKYPSCSGRRSTVTTWAPASARLLHHCIAWHWHIGQRGFV